MDEPPYDPKPAVPDSGEPTVEATEARAPARGRAAVFAAAPDGVIAAAGTEAGSGTIVPVNAGRASARH
jgi:hypothetical protein